MGNLPATILEAIRKGEPISEDQLRQLIAAEAQALNMTFEQAVEAAHDGRLPAGNMYAADIEMLVELLPVRAA